MTDSAKQNQTSGVFTVTEGGTPPSPVPVGVYNAKLMDWEKKDDGQFGAYVKLEFSIADGDHKDERRDMLVSAKIAKGRNDDKTSKLYKVIRALLGRDLQKDERVDLTKLIGSPCQILISDNFRDGENWQKITQVLPAVSK